MTEIALMLVLGIVPAVLVVLVWGRLFGRRMGDLHQWVTDHRTRLERLERECAAISGQLGNLPKGDAKVDRLGKHLAQLATDLQTEREALEARLQVVEREQVNLNRRQESLAQGSAPPRELTDASQRAASPVVGEVLELIGQGIEPAEVARRTGLQLGEVELIRALRSFAGKEQTRP